MKKLFNFLIEDFKSDIDWFKKGCPIKKDVKHAFSNSNFWLDVIKDNWLMFLLVIMAFFTGMFLAYVLAYQHYDNFIINEVLPNCYDWQRAYDFPGKERFLTQ